MPEREGNVWLIAALVVLAGTFAIDLAVPLGAAVAVLYGLAILIAVPNRRIGALFMLAATAVALSAIAYWLRYPPPSGIPFEYVIANRVLGLFAIAMAAGLGTVLIRHWHSMSQAQSELDYHKTLVDMASRLARFGAWSYDLENNQIQWTDQVARIHEIEPGYSPKLEDGIEFYAPEYRDEVRGKVARCLEDGTPWDEEWQLVTAQGRRLWVRAIGEPVRDESGRIIGAQGAFQDIDDRKRAEATAEQHKARLWQMAESMPILVWTAGREGQLDFVNQMAVAYTGAAERGALLGDKWVDVIHPEDRDRTIADWTHSIETGKPYSNEFRIRGANGTYRWFHTSAMPMLDDNGNAEHWFGACVDIQEQRELSHRLVQTLENMTDAFFALDSDWRFIYVNRQGERLTDRDRGELIGKVIWDTFPEARDSIFEHQYRQAMETGQPAKFAAPYEPLGVWLDISAYPNDESLGIYVRDITRQRKAEEQLRQAQRLESIGQLTGGIAHDFNNLLTVVMGNAELIRELSTDHPQIGELAEMVGKAAQRGSNLTNRLLAFARKQALAPVSVDINQLISDMGPLLRRALGEAIQIEVTCASDLWPALIDPGQLENALLNLCLNARDAMSDGGRLTIMTSNIRIDADDDTLYEGLSRGEYVSVTVSDTGHGIDPEHIERVFDPFFTSGKKEKGTGLGLAMVYGFVKQSGGNVQIESRPEQGTTVRLHLPRCEESPALDIADKHEPFGGQETILLVEDDDMLRPVARRNLELLGYTVLEAANGFEAIQLLESSQPIDLLFTDVVMPGGMNGRQLAEKAASIRSGLKVLYTSGYSEDDIVHDGRLDPGVHLLSKPYTRPELAAAIRSIFDERL